MKKPMLLVRHIKENEMKAIIKQIQEALEHGRALNVKTGPVAAQVLKEMQKNSSGETPDLREKEIS